MGSCNRAACTSDSVWADCQIMNACQSWHERANCLLPLRMMTVMPLTTRTLLQPWRCNNYSQTCLFANLPTKHHYNVLCKRLELLLARSHAHCRVQCIWRGGISCSQLQHSSLRASTGQFKGRTLKASAQRLPLSDNLPRMGHILRSVCAVIVVSTSATTFLLQQVKAHFSFPAQLSKS